MKAWYRPGACTPSGMRAMVTGSSRLIMNVS
jgi:hypothetical protein